MPDDDQQQAADLRALLDASPSPFHAVAEAAARLDAAGFVERREVGDWPATGSGYVIRGGSLVAWSLDAAGDLDTGFRIIGAHTDSPNLRIKPRPDTGRAGYRQLGVEVYGGALHNSWLDRDLGISGRVTVRDGDGSATTTRLLKVDRPLLRVPQLAIHLDRGVNDGLTLNAQQHLVPVWGVGSTETGAFTRFVADELGTDTDAVLAWDLMTHDLTPSATLGRDDELLASGRIDNLLSCWAALTALITAAGQGDSARDGVPVICLFDHEEIGSESASGAAGSILPTILERIALAAGADRTGLLRALAASRCVSADGAHATHPNYAERHEPGHQIAINGGPVIKLNANMRYATDAESSGWFKLAAERAGVPTQEFVVRSDMPCGSTIGPITAARLGIPTVDVGVAQLSMHSARELCGSEDPHLFVRALTSFLR